MTLYDDSGIVVGPCPLCHNWQVQVEFSVECDWRGPGALVEEAIAEHVDDDLARFAATNEQTR